MEETSVKHLSASNPPELSVGRRSVRVLVSTTTSQEWARDYGIQVYFSLPFSHRTFHFLWHYVFSSQHDFGFLSANIPPLPNTRYTAYTVFNCLYHLSHL